MAEREAASEASVDSKSDIVQLADLGKFFSQPEGGDKFWLKRNYPTRWPS